MGTSIVHSGPSALILFVTNGAPDFEESYFTDAGYESKEVYEQTRISEALSAGEQLGVKKENIFFLGFKDQGTHKKISSIINKIVDLTNRKKISHIHTFCYEGHHPDHEVVRFAAWFAAKRTNTKLTEHSANLIRHQIFDIPEKNSFTKLILTEEEKKKRRDIMHKTYVSQKLNPAKYKDTEYVREAQDNDYSVLRNTKELRFETVKPIRLTRKEILSAFKEYEEGMNHD